MTLISKLALNGFSCMSKRKMLGWFVVAVVSLALLSANGCDATNRMA
jgi:hypothetical protein